MPRIFDNIELKLENALKESLEVAHRADFCVGFFNLRGWHLLQENIDKFEGGDNKNCRLLIGMQKTPIELLKNCYSINKNDDLDRAQAKKLISQTVKDFREQLIIGIPDEKQEFALKKLLNQLKNEKVKVKLYLKDLHAKLYLAHREDKINAIIPYLGSSNLKELGGDE